MSRAYLALVLVLFLLAACAKPAPVEVQVPMTVVVRQTVVVQETVSVPVTVQVAVPQTVIVTATPWPTPPDTPTVIATPQPTATIPPGWKTYEDVTGDFSMQYPDQWVVENQRSSYVYFALPGSAGVGFEVKNRPYPGNSQEALDNYVRAILDSQDSLDTVKVLDKTIQSDPADLMIVMLQVTDYVYKSTSFCLYALYGIDSAHCVEVQAFRIGGAITTDEGTNFGKALASVTLRR
jgi:hypothetical protein